MSSKVIISIIILLQISVIVFLANKIVSDKKNTSGKQVINPIRKENIIKVNSELKQFYEPKPSEDIIDEVPFPATYTINADSLNERFDYEPKKSSEVFRIITIGDSFTYGIYVNTENNWTELVEDQLNNLICQNKTKYEVINLGVAGYDIQYSVERYKNRGIKYDPDLVIWFLKLDDVFHINEIMIEREIYHREKMKETGEFQKLIDNGNLYPSWEKARNEMVTDYGQTQIFHTQNRFLNTFRDMYKNELVIVSFDSEPYAVRQFIKDFSLKDQSTHHFDNLRTIYNDQKLIFKNDHHPTVEGHKVIAEEIMSYLNDNNLVQCN